MFSPIPPNFNTTHKHTFHHCHHYRRHRTITPSKIILVVYLLSLCSHHTTIGFNPNSVIWDSKVITDYRRQRREITITSSFCSLSRLVSYNKTYRKMVSSSSSLSSSSSTSSARVSDKRKGPILITIGPMVRTHTLLHHSLTEFGTIHVSYPSFFLTRLYHIKNMFV